ncbi:I-set and TSP 1 domain containing protein [Trichuris trichiura]|uniref:I-set and TSP 1 domain containing protein n=1 Tax=Trichuris trichiura TaxID=36087 RepID=A0A077YZT2_TRITR|nr:I-set and TSP 1 domain containing protein [Trichuris trichiura]
MCDKPQLQNELCYGVGERIYHGAMIDHWELMNQPQNPCSPICKAPMHGITVSVNKKLTDGKLCGADSNYVCVDGECLVRKVNEAEHLLEDQSAITWQLQEIGCDGIVNSGKRLDYCGVCNGDGTTCGRPTYVWKMTDQYSECDVTCGAKGIVRIVLSCALIALDPSMSLSWTTGRWEDCNASCGGGWQSRAVFCFESYNSTEGKQEKRYVDESYCWKKRKPLDRQRCNQQGCPKWEVGEWSQCSATCGNGVKYRRVACRLEKGKEISHFSCDPKKMPTEEETCAAPLSCEEAEKIQSAKLKFYKHSFITLLCRSESSKVNEFKHHLWQSKIETCSLYYFSWMPGPWKPCSTTCGLGVKTREVQCVAMQLITQNLAILPEYECDSKTKPQEFYPCEVTACPRVHAQSTTHAQVDTVRSFNEYRWDFKDWGPCSASCLGGNQYFVLYKRPPRQQSLFVGIQSTTLRCVHVHTGTEVAWSNCNPKQRPANSTRSCNNHPCPPRWEIGDWSICSHTCGGGIRTRQVRCLQDINRNEKMISTMIMPGNQCSSPKPVSRQSCASDSCPPHWVVGPWSECSVTCGPGEQYRAIECEQLTLDGTTKRYDPPNPCSNLPKPPIIQLCSLAATCPSGKLKGYHAGANAFMSASPNSGRRRLTFRVGGRATLFEGTNLKIKCPAVGTTDVPIKWLKNGEFISRTDRVQISKNGALRINEASYKDAGVYTCMFGGDKRNITLIFKPRKYGAKAKTLKKPRKFKSSMKAKQKQLTQQTQNEKNSTYSIESFNVQPEAMTPAMNLWESEKLLDAETGQDTKPAEQTFSEALSEKENQLQDGTESDDKTEAYQLPPSTLYEDLKANLRSRGAMHVYHLLISADDLASVKFSWVTGMWSPCSKTCQSKNGGGMQFRSVQCKAEIDGRSSYVDDSICIHANFQKPYETQFCGTDPCPEWYAEEWSECADSRCIRFSTAVQRRTVRCIFLNGTQAGSPSMCNRITRPRQKKECFNKNCVAEWRTGDWLPCSKTCGDFGVQMRIANCVWHKTHKPAGNSCSSSLRPTISRPCEKLQPCPNEKSRYKMDFLKGWGR